MAGQTTSTHLSEELASVIGGIAKDEARSPSQLLSMGADLFAHVSPAARRAIISLLAGSEAERAFAFKAIGRSALSARERALTSRNLRPYSPVSNQDLDDENGIEAEAVAGTRP